MPATTNINNAPVGTTGVAMHFRGTLNASVLDLTALLATTSAVIPSWVVGNETRYPSIVAVALITGATATARVTYDGATDPHLANGIGLLIPVEPAGMLQLPAPGQIKAGSLRFIASGAVTVVVAFVP